jgi:hypothetical protein
MGSIQFILDERKGRNIKSREKSSYSDLLLGSDFLNRPTPRLDRKIPGKFPDVCQEEEKEK